MSALAGAIERKARELGVVYLEPVSIPPVGFAVELDGETGEVLFWRAVVGRCEGFESHRCEAAMRVPMVTAAAYLIAMESRRMVPWGRCFECDGQCWVCQEPRDMGCSVCDGTADRGCVHCSEACTVLGNDGKTYDRSRATGISQKSLAEAVMLVTSTPSDLHAWGIERGHPRDRDTVTVYLEEMMAGGDPLGEVLALWMAGQLEARHVLGVGDETARTVEHEAWLTRAGWECTGGRTTMGGETDPCSFWRGPVLMVGAS